MDASAIDNLAAAFVRAPQIVAVLRANGDVPFVHAPNGIPDKASLGELFDAPSVAQIWRVSTQVSAEGSPREVEAAGAGGGTTFLVSLSPAPNLATDAVLLIGTNITARKRMEDELRRSQTLLVDTQGVAHLGTWEWDISEPNARWSDELYRIYGLTRGAYTPSYENYLAMVHPDDRGYVQEATERVFKEHQPYSHDERIVQPDGTLRHLHTWAYPILEEGQLVRLVGVCQDITDRKSAENALADRALELARSNDLLRAEMAERARIEARLRDAHKLEAIGRLAGGISHDFNNLLSVVMGRGGLLERALAPDDPLRHHASEIVDVARQAARLTHQLLLFSREQVTRHEVQDLGEVVQELLQMLRTLVGEDVVFDVTTMPTGLLVTADRSQLEQVVMNLVVNARDAMPTGGTLTLSLSSAPGADLASVEVEPRKTYAILTISDTGVGMDDAVLSRLFDPYFTTKAEGHGLGLSTVYGIVRQLGGAITVRSAPKRGSHFAVFLPRSDRPRSRLVTDSPIEELRGSATILLVEDQSSVRRLVREQLEELGYRVLDAATPSEAIEVCTCSPIFRIDLLATDVVMPQMNGVDLARTLRDSVPGLRTLFMSGWANRALIGELEESKAPLLRKPFTLEALARAVRDALRS